MPLEKEGVHAGNTRTLISISFYVRVLYARAKHTRDARVHFARTERLMCMKMHHDDLLEMGKNDTLA